MRIEKSYSHLNGEEYLIVHRPELHAEIIQVIGEIDAANFKTIVSKERGREGNLLYNPTELNSEFKRCFEQRRWESVTRRFYISDRYEIVDAIERMNYSEQREYLESLGHPLVSSSTQTDSIKQRVAVEVQLGNYFAVTYDLFVKHFSFFNCGVIDVGVEIVPTKELQAEMSSGPPFFEKEVHNVLRHGRSSPAVPVWMIGISP